MKYKLINVTCFVSFNFFVYLFFFQIKFSTTISWLESWANFIMMVQENGIPWPYCSLLQWPLKILLLIFFYLKKCVAKGYLGGSVGRTCNSWSQVCEFKLKIKLPLFSNHFLSACYVLCTMELSSTLLRR